jgi:hypothetical protein
MSSRMRDDLFAPKTSHRGGGNTSRMSDRKDAEQKEEVSARFVLVD